MSGEANCSCFYIYHLQTTALLYDNIYEPLLQYKYSLKTNIFSLCVGYNIAKGGEWL